VTTGTAPERSLCRAASATICWLSRRAGWILDAPGIVGRHRGLAAIIRHQAAGHRVLLPSSTTACATCRSRSLPGRAKGICAHHGGLSPAASQDPRRSGKEGPAARKRV